MVFLCEWVSVCVCMRVNEWTYKRAKCFFETSQNLSRSPHHIDWWNHRNTGTHRYTFVSLCVCVCVQTECSDWHEHDVDKATHKSSNRVRTKWHHTQNVLHSLDKRTKEQTDRQESDRETGKQTFTCVTDDESACIGFGWLLGWLAGRQADRLVAWPSCAVLLFG